MERLRLLLTLLITFLFTINASVAELLPVEAFGKLPEATQVKLAPSGYKLAFIRNIKGSSYIGVTDLVKGGTNYIIKTDNQEFKLGWYIWANNDMLLISADYPVQKGTLKYSEARLFKLNIDGKSSPETVFTPKSSELIPQFQNNIIDMLPDEPNHFLMALDLKNPNRPDVYKIDLNSSRFRELIYKGKSNISNWLTDRQHRVRLGYGRDETKIFYRLYDIKTDDWRNIWEYEIFDAPDITPLGFGLDPNTLYIRANHNGRYAIFKVDVSNPELPRELVHADENYDIEGSLIYSRITNDVIGVYHGEASDSKIFFDPNYAAFQKALNTAIPDAYNDIASMSADERKYILFTSSPTSPGAYYLGDRDTQYLAFVLEHYPMLFGKQLSGKQKITYKTRDNIEIEAYVTLPHGDAIENGPAIVVPHGGPMARNYGGFDWFTEFFANRGYTIIEPNFRGSSGYGFEFEMASVQQWGGAMQDDLQDAAQWLAKNHSIDKNRICIVGASYGGYAALMAAAKQQETFRCAASIAGVSDLELIIKKARRFTNKEVVRKQLGTDTDKLEESSPINYTKKINIPVLLIHGEDDRVVDVNHSRNMYEELKDENKVVEYIELPNGNHYLEIEENRLKTLSAIERFLSQNLSKAQVN